MLSVIPLRGHIFAYGRLLTLLPYLILVAFFSANLKYLVFTEFLQRDFLIAEIYFRSKLSTAISNIRNLSSLMITAFISFSL